MASAPVCQVDTAGDNCCLMLFRGLLSLALLNNTFAISCIFSEPIESSPKFGRRTSQLHGLVSILDDHQLHCVQQIRHRITVLQTNIKSGFTNKFKEQGFHRLRKT